MYTIGNHVVHPCYGAGTIETIQVKHIGATHQRYYVIRILTSSNPMQVMVPVGRADDLGLRRIAAAPDLLDALASCQRLPEEKDVEKDYRARQTEMGILLKTGRIDDLAFVLRSLNSLKKKRGLSAADRTLWIQAKERLASEMALGLEEALDDIVRDIEDRLEAA